MNAPSSHGEAPTKSPAAIHRWLSVAAKSLLSLALFALFLGAGLWLGPQARAFYDRMFPEPVYVTGNYDALYRQAGKPVVMFSTSTCPYCQRTRELLTSQNVDFQDFVIDQSADAKTQFKTLGGVGVPMVFIGDKRIVGFREGILRESLASIHR